MAKVEIWGHTAPQETYLKARFLKEQILQTETVSYAGLKILQTLTQALQSDPKLTNQASDLLQDLPPTPTICAQPKIVTDIVWENNGTDQIPYASLKDGTRAPLFAPAGIFIFEVEIGQPLNIFIDPIFGVMPFWDNSMIIEEIIGFWFLTNTFD